MGVTAALLLAVAPVGIPVLNATTENIVSATTLDKEATYTNNGDGTYTLHGTLDGEVWSNGSPTGIPLPISVEGKIVTLDELGFGEIQLPTISGYSVSHLSETEVGLDNGKVSRLGGLIYDLIDGSIDTTNRTPGVEYSATVTINTTDNSVAGDNSNLIRVAGPQKFVHLPVGSVWKVDRKMVKYGATYYRIGNNEWVEDATVTQKANVKNPNIVTTKKLAVLYTSKGNKITDRLLAANTDWYTDRNTTINGQKMYRVATDEWVAASDIK